MQPRTVVLLLFFVNLLIGCVAVSQTIGALATSPSTQLGPPLQLLLTSDQHLRLDRRETFVQLGTGAIHQ